MADGNAVAGGSGYSRYNWHSYMNVAQVASTDTTVTYRVTLGYSSYYAINVHANGRIDGGASWNGSIVAGGNGYWQGANVAISDFTVPRGDSAYTKTFSGYVQATGGFGNGTSRVSASVTVPAIPYKKPDPPSELSARRNSDHQVAASWKNNPVGVTKKYTGVRISLETDGNWSESDLPADSTGVTKEAQPNHRYRFAVRSKNSAGMSDWVYSGYVYTTPSAPANCSAERKSDTQASVTWDLGANAANSWLNVLVERRTDEEAWTQIATLGKSARNYIDNGIGANHRYQYRVRAYNGLYSGYSSSGYIYTTPAAPKAVNLSKIGGTSVRISVDSASPYADGYLYQLSVNGGGWSDEKAMGTSVDVDAGGGTVKARVRAKRGSLYSAYRESGTVTTIVAPSAPTIGELGSVYAIPATVRVVWTRLHPDGTEQTAAQVEVTDPKGGVATIDVGAENYTDIELDTEGEYRVRVRTKGLDPSWGAWSPHGSFHAEYAPQAFFTKPAMDGAVVSGVPFTVEWRVESSSGVSSQEVRLLSSGGDVLYSATVPNDAREFRFSVDTYLPQTMRDYTVAVLVSDGYSLTAQAMRRVSTDYAEPAIPYIEVSNDPADMSAHVTVMQGEGGWVVDEDGILHSPEYWDGSVDRVPVNAGFEEAGVLGVVGIGTVVETVKLSVARQLDDGTQEMLTDDLPSGHEVIDRLPPLNTDYTYLITAYSAAGTATTAEIEAFVDSDGNEAYNFGPDASAAVLLRFDADASASTSHGGEWFQFATGPDSPALPSFYPDGSLSASGNHSYIVTDVDEYRRIDALRRVRANAVCWYRDHWGGRHRVKADWTLGYAAASFGRWSVASSLTEVVWEGPRNG